MKVNNKAYNVLKPIALIWLPALGTLFFALSALWSLPHATSIIGSLTAIDGFLGTVLHLSSQSYSANKAVDGNLVIDKSNPAKDTYSLELATPVAELDGKDSITLKVGKAAVNS